MSKKGRRLEGKDFCFNTAIGTKRVASMMNAITRVAQPKPMTVQDLTVSKASSWKTKD